MVQVFAGALNARVIAEGVETTAQRNELLALGCTHGQGFFYYAKAMPPDGLEMLLMGHVRLPVPKQSDREHSDVPRG